MTTVICFVVFAGVGTALRWLAVDTWPGGYRGTLAVNVIGALTLGLLGAWTGPGLTVVGTGALGSLGLAFHSASAVRADCRALREATNGSYNINFFVHREPKQDPVRDESMRAALAPVYQELGLGEVPLAQASAPPFNAEHLEAVLEMAPAVVSFHFGLPSESLFRPL